MKCLIMTAGLALVMPELLFAQINWTEYTIAANFDRTWFVYAAV